MFNRIFKSQKVNTENNIIFLLKCKLLRASIFIFFSLTFSLVVVILVVVSEFEGSILPCVVGPTRIKPAKWAC